MSDTRAFRGVWIPAGLWLNRDLSLQEKVMLVEIDSLQHPERGCFKSNSKLAEFFGLSTSRISAIISSLSEKGFVRVDQVREGKRVIERRIFMVKPLGLQFGVQETEQGWSGNKANPSQDAEGGWSGSSEGRGSVRGVQEEGNPNDNRAAMNDAFELFWTAGMVKVGKAKAKAKFEKLVRDSKEEPEAFARKLVRDVKARMAAQVFGFDRLHPTTYLNGERWNDEVVQGDLPPNVRSFDEHRQRADVEVKRGPVRGRPIPYGSTQPDEDGILTLPDGTRCHVDDWDSGNVAWEGQV